MPDTNEVRLERMTRREFRQRLQAGDLKLAIIPGRHEQDIAFRFNCLRSARGYRNGCNIYVT